MGFSKHYSWRTLNVRLTRIVINITKHLGVDLLFLLLLLLGQLGPTTPRRAFRAWLHSAELTNQINYYKCGYYPATLGHLRLADSAPTLIFISKLINFLYR